MCLAYSGLLKKYRTLGPMAIRTASPYSAAAWLIRASRFQVSLFSRPRVAVRGGPGRVRCGGAIVAIGVAIGSDPSEVDEGVGDPLPPQLVGGQVLGVDALGPAVGAELRGLFGIHAAEHLSGHRGVRDQQAGLQP